MEKIVSTHKIQTVSAAKTILKPDLVVLSGINELDALLGGFKAGEISFIDGNSDLISVIPNRLCVNTFRTFSSDTVYVDGGMCADPYKIARYARMMELDEKEILEHIHISRAFTVYQMSTVIHDMLEPVIKRYKPRTLIVGRFPTLYLDTDVKTKEAKTILKNDIEKIRALTTKYDLITVFTNLDKMSIPGCRNVRREIYSNVDEIIRLKEQGQSSYVNLLKRKQETIILSFAKGQMRLLDFGMVI